MHPSPTPNRRHVFFNIATVPTGFSTGRGTFVALDRRVSCICILTDDGSRTAEYVFIGRNEKLLLHNFWERIKRFDMIVAAELVESDWAYVCQRTFICGLAPVSESELQSLYSHDLVNICQVRNEPNFDLELAGMNELKGFGVDKRALHNELAAVAWNTDDWGPLVEACQSSIRVLFNTHLTLTGQFHRYVG